MRRFKLSSLPVVKPQLQTPNTTGKKNTHKNPCDSLLGEKSNQTFPGRSCFLVAGRITDVMQSTNSCTESGRAPLQHLEAGEN